MADNQQPDPANTAANTTNAAKDPDDWVTGDEPMTGPQASYLETRAPRPNHSLNAD